MVRSKLPAFACCIIAVVMMSGSAAGAEARAPTTHPSEAVALNSIFDGWGLSAGNMGWNVSGELCSGTATDDTQFNNEAYNPFIKCECFYDNNSTCRITHLKVDGKDVSGPIPDLLWNLTYLNNIVLSKNYLTGHLSPLIGNLTRLEYLTVGSNALSGPLPKELGKLTNLLSLSFGVNNFSGSLPPELGSLTKLSQLYFDSAGVSGEIPPTFANLRSLEILWGPDNELTGTIPDFIGNLPNLKSLKFQGNSFRGPIPSTFINLTSMEDLRISDVINGSSSLEFIKNMKSLTILILRNNDISGMIPATIGDFQKLSLLDLSFNNISGNITDSLFTLSGLSYLFLGSNRLTGNLLAQKSSSLLIVDVSDNYLSGSFPSWISEPNLKLNLVANNFTIEKSNSRLKCLQRNFPCGRGRGIYSDFAINCGGPQITSSSRVVFEKEDEDLGPSSYYVADTERWAVSKVGFFLESKNAPGKVSSSSPVTNTLDQELFQTARVSFGSLRYYGLGLENGNYSLSLQFAESMILGSNRWESVGRRVFDIYIQGNLAIRNFDIRKEAGGPSNVAVKENFTALVSENYIEIHLFWAGKGTCCVPGLGTFGPMISAINAIPNFEPTVPNKLPSERRSSTNTRIIVPVTVVSMTTLILALAAYYYIRRRFRDSRNAELELRGMQFKPNTFSYSELKTATRDFSFANILGEGGFGPVYKGKLHDGRTVAVKRLAKGSEQGKSQFYAEIATISAVQHRNLVKLYGCCLEGARRLLVYEYLENKSLDQAMFGERTLELDWATRFNICLGVARGLTYLHEESQVRIVHRDVKASNILLDSDLNPKISDFGLAKLYDNKQTHMSTRVAGTICYLAPQYAMRGHLTEKADVFGFGVLALEIVSGRPNCINSDQKQMYLLQWDWGLYENSCGLELVDPKLLSFSAQEVRRVIRVALMCIQSRPATRHPMSRVVAILSGDADVTTALSKPVYLSNWMYDDDESPVPTIHFSTSEEAENTQQLLDIYQCRSVGNPAFDSESTSSSPQNKRSRTL
uniref:non-specific serine/threonine protein kinase n=1 Tax=Kalanchoe fedtschenkoi TaxID=63787 RepID=A0A7N0VE03_KALFE